jgi:hypothetical protein
MAIVVAIPLTAGAGTGSPVATGMLGDRTFIVHGPFTGAIVVQGSDDGLNFQNVASIENVTDVVEVTDQSLFYRAVRANPLSGTPSLFVMGEPDTAGPPVAVTQGTVPWITQDTANGATAAAVPARALQIGGPDAGGLLRAPSVLPSAPVGTEEALVTRNIPSGTQPVSGTVTANQGTPGAVGSAWPVEQTNGAGTVIGTAANPTRVDPTGTTTQPISAAALPLPTGASTSANQTNGTQTTQINQGGNTAIVTGAGALKVDGSASTQPVSGTVSATQGTSPWVDNLTQINGAAVTTQAAGEQLVAVEGRAASGSAVTGNPALVGGSDGVNARTMRTAADGTVRTDPTGTTTQPVSGTVTANQGGAPWSQNITQVGGTAVTLGQKTSANSIPVVVASDQSDIGVKQATAANLNAQVQGAAANGAAGVGNPVRVAGKDGGGVIRDVLTDTDGTVETNITKYGGTATSLGQKTMAASIPVAIASDQSAIPTTVAASTKATFAASTNGVVGTGTASATVQSLAYLFHTGASTKTIKIMRIVIGWAGNGGNNSLTFRGAFITAENGAPGGTSQTINSTKRSNTADATDTFRTGANAPTYVTGDLIAMSAIGGSSDQQHATLYEDGDLEEPITLRAGTAEGFDIRSVIGGSNLASAVNVSVYYFWTEE